jgi:hypothetical protein
MIQNVQRIDGYSFPSSIPRYPKQHSTLNKKQSVLRQPRYLRLHAHDILRRAQIKQSRGLARNYNIFTPSSTDQTPGIRYKIPSGTGVFYTGRIANLKVHAALYRSAHRGMLKIKR